LKFNLSESRELNKGLSVVRYFVHPQTGERYAAEVKRSWNKVYFSCGDGWHRSARAAREAMLLPDSAYTFHGETLDA
jgi:hypothetical protein